MEEKKKKIKNINYRKFLDEGIIEFIEEEHLERALENIRHKNLKESRALLILLYYTGCRPIEGLRLKGKDITKKGTHILIKLPGSKRGLPRTIYLPTKRKGKTIKPVTELYRYATSLFAEAYLFFSYRKPYKRIFKNKKGEIKERKEYSDTLRYHLKKWFENVISGSITPYYLRHNRFSKLMQKGATIEEIRMLKGSRTFASVTPYIHLSTQIAKNLAKKMN